MLSLKTIRPAVLTATGLAVLLPGAWAAAGVLIGGCLWTALRPSRRSTLLVIPLGVIALFLLLADATVGFRQGRVSPERAAERLHVLLDDLDRQAAAAAALVRAAPESLQDRSRAFDDLQRLAAESRSEGEQGAFSWFLFDPNGVAVAWAGRGLVHEIDGGFVPRSGRKHIPSFSASTFISVAPLDDSRRPWRVAVGISIPSDRLPGSARSTAQWAIVGADEVAGADAVIAEFGDVRLSVREDSLELLDARGRLRPWAGLLLALALGFGAMRRYASARLDGAALLLALGSATVATFAWSLTPWLLVPFAVGVGLAVLPIPDPAGSARGSGWFVDTALGMAAVLVIVFGSALLQLTTASVDLGRYLVGDAESIALRAAMFGLAFGMLRAARRSAGGTRNEPGTGWALLAAIVLLLSAAIHGWVILGVGALLVGSVLAFAWARRGGWSDGAVGLVTGCILAALMAAIGWEVSYHRTIEGRLERFLLEDLAAPGPEETRAVATAAEEFFDELELEKLTVRDPGSLDPQDLAYAVWRRSPLAKLGQLSRVTVGAFDSPLSSFSYRLPAVGSAVVESGSAFLTPALPGWEDARVTGRGMLTLGGGPWAEVDYEVLLRPGFREAGSPLPKLAEGLLRRQARPWAVPQVDFPQDALLGVYTLTGELLVPPWKGAPNLPLGPVPARLEIPGGWARTFVVSDESAVRVAFLPVPPPLIGVERVATYAAGPLVLLLAGAALWLLMTLSEVERRRALAAEWRSFSKRLVVLYSLLLLVPILLLNFLVLRVFEDRLEREQRSAGQAALESAQRILGDYVFSLDPGFGIDTAVGDDVLLWLSTVVHHDVNLYWGSRLSASSKRELISSGLLPQRIPGDIFSRIALEGASLASRTTRAGGAVYEEFYAPLEAPGVESEDAGLFVSTPLLAQEVAAAEEMRTIRHRLFLAGAGVALLLVLLGRRVGRSFTRPLLQIVEGTQAIAAGAPSIVVDASDSEFVTLVDAIDEMARRIAAARSDLLREKEVVDRMIDNITSGVVSVDREGRALLLNRTAHELLGIRAGELVVEAVKRDERLLPVARFLDDVSAGSARRTVLLAADDGGETEWTLVWVPLAGPGEPAALFVIEDVTEVLRGQRLHAWAEMARMIAHEVKNPLTPIRLSTEHLREVHKAGGRDLDAVLERCTVNILQQVDELQQIVSDFSAYSRIPAIDPQSGDLADLVEEVVEGYMVGGPLVAFERLDGPWDASFDAKLLGRAVRNVLENAVRATRQGGGVEVTVRGRDETLEILVADGGTGIAATHLPKIFEPYFSTEASGTGLGLPIAMRIVEEHGGSMSARNRSPRGLEVVMILPRAEQR